MNTVASTALFLSVLFWVYSVVCLCLSIRNLRLARRATGFLDDAIRAVKLACEVAIESDSDRAKLKQGLLRIQDLCVLQSDGAITDPGAVLDEIRKVLADMSFDGAMTENVRLLEREMAAQGNLG